MNPFRCIVTVGNITRVIIYNRGQTEREETVKQQLAGDIQCDAVYWCRTRSNQPPGCLWQLWQSASTLMEPARPNRIFFFLMQFTHSDVWSELAITPERSFNIGEKHKKMIQWHSDRWAICKVTHGIEAGRGVIVQRGVCNRCDAAHPIWQSHSAQPDTVFADENVSILFHIGYNFVAEWLLVASIHHKNTN